MGVNRNGPLPQRKKNILLVMRWPVGGIRTFLRYVYKMFDPDEWVISVIAPDIPGMRVLLEEDLAHLDIQFIPLDIQMGELRLMWSITKVVARGKYDLIHSHGYTAGILTSLSAKLFKTKHLVTPHDTFTSNQFPGWKGKVKLALIARLLNLADGIQSVSHDAQENLKQYLPAISLEKCQVNPSGIEIDRFLEAGIRDFRSEMELDPDVYLIGFLGRFMSPKGFRDLVLAIEILSHSPNLKQRPLVLTFGKDGFFARDQRFVRSLGLEDCFCFLPFTANVAESIKGLDVVVMPSLREACGLLAMETLVSGTPLIASDCIGLREVVKDTPAAVFPVGNSRELADVLADYMAVDKRQLFASFQSTAADRFDVSRQVKRMMDLYRDMI